MTNWLARARKVAAEAEKPVAERPLSSAELAELRRLIAVAAGGWSDEGRKETEDIALSDPANALVCFRELAKSRQSKSELVAVPAPEVPTCRQCANLASGGRCLAAERGESFGLGIGTSRTWTPHDPDALNRCGAFKPKPNDPDQRTGRERWPMLFRRYG